MKVKKEDYENIYDCIVTDQVPPDVINEYFEDKNFYRYYIIRRSTRWLIKNKKVNIEVSTYNWGPCVTKFKILDDFKKLIDEAKKNEEDYASKLAGQIRKETGYGEESRGRIIPYLAPYLGIYDQAFQRYQTKEYELGKPEYALTALWCNYQRQHEFNPPHDHDGKLSLLYTCPYLTR